MQSVPPPTTIAPGVTVPMTSGVEVDALLALASAGDVRTIARQIQARAEVDGSVTPTLERWVVPALRETGLRWQRHEYSVADDHVITNTLSEALGVARAAMPPIEVHGTAAAVTLGSDQHEICARLTQVCLDGAGFSCVLLGRGLPIGDLVRWVNETSPDILPVAPEARASPAACPSPSTPRAPTPSSSPSAPRSVRAPPYISGAPVLHSWASSRRGSATCARSTSSKPP